MRCDRWSTAMLGPGLVACLAIGSAGGVVHANMQYC